MDEASIAELMRADLSRSDAYDRYPTRFLSMKYDAGISNAVIKLAKEFPGLSIFDLRQTLTHDDGWLPKERFSKTICDMDPSRSFIIVGFSEYARFLNNEEFISILLNLLQIENDPSYPKRRLYFPCFALYSQIKKIVKTYHRRMDSYNPFINDTDIEDLPRIYFVKSGLDTDGSNNELLTSSEWFSMWRNQDIDTQRPIICMSNTLAYYYKLASPDNVYNIRNLESYQDILMWMYSINNLRAYKNDPENFFRKFISLIKNAGNKDVKGILLKELNTQNVSNGNFYSLWKDCDTFGRWLLQNYILMQFSETSYLYRIMQQVEELSEVELLEQVYIEIFDRGSETQANERRIILNSINRINKEIPFSDRLIAYYNKILTTIIHNNTALSIDNIDLRKDDERIKGKESVLVEAIFSKFVQYLTCYSVFERRLVIWLYRMQLVSIEQLKEIYPALWIYASIKESYAAPNKYAEDLDAYFDTYRLLRLGQKDPSIYEDSLLQWNDSEENFYNWYFDDKLKFPEVYLKERQFNGTVYVLDAVGAEFLNYIVKLLENRGYSVSEINYAKSHLPSITSIAQCYYPQNYKWIYDYDSKVIHGENFYPTYNLELALSVIETMIDKITTSEGSSTFVITADHGATVGHKILKKEKKYDFEQSEHDGRCMLVKDSSFFTGTSDYLVYEEELSNQQWLVTLNQQSLFNNSKYAVHGGATPEEVFVPVIIAKKGKGQHVAYKVKAADLHVSGLKKKIEFKIHPKPQEEKVILRAKDGTDTTMLYDEANMSWYGTLKRGIEQQIQVTIGSQTFAFKTIPPTKMGDDLFDD